MSLIDGSINPTDVPDVPDTAICPPALDSDSDSYANASSPEHIPSVPPPWTLKGDVYSFSWWTTGAQAKAGLPSMAYSPLEAASGYAAPESGKPVGGLSMIQILRYKDSPVGPYDELLVVPGSFDYTRDDAQDWNVPKHLARFDWSNNPDGSTTIKVFPHDTHPDDDIAEATASPVPFFQASFKPWRFAPSFPFATTWVNYLGITSTLVNPPLPQGNGSQGELPGTNRWCSVVPQQYSRRTMLGWFDIAQHRDDKGQLTGEHDNFWPTLNRWQLGMKMENADLAFGHPEETWDPPRSHL
ncbi:hypothetical protein AK830_g487 [Neonectria ditissima]|uniref:Uncharacterized protein n=1 Tax=Neonectria ditissima TaxID=78410 RepID=A0A0P7BLI7_9HYPO|nr:hypothetical protein AK830_g487 [Neonectria ditissima]